MTNVDDLFVLYRVFQCHILKFLQIEIHKESCEILKQKTRDLLNDPVFASNNFQDCQKYLVCIWKLETISKTKEKGNAQEPGSKSWRIFSNPIFNRIMRNYCELSKIV